VRERFISKPSTFTGTLGQKSDNGIDLWVNSLDLREMRVRHLPA
jgi:hypothetical protein